MAHVFVSYSNQDRSRVAPLVEALRAEGLDVWWDVDIPANAPWAETIEHQLNAAAAVLVCWSHTSAASENVREEARRARSQHKLVQSYIEDCPPPLFFGEHQGAMLAGWDGSRSHDRFRLLVQGLQALLSGQPVPAKLHKRIGYTPPKGAGKTPAVLAAVSVLALTSVGIVWLPEVRTRIFPEPTPDWIIEGDDQTLTFLPMRSPEESNLAQQFSRLVLIMEPAFIADRKVDEPATVSDIKLTFTHPDGREIVFDDMYETDLRNETGWLDRIRDATPQTLTESRRIQIAFQPHESYRWQDLANDVLKYQAEDSRFAVRMEARLRYGGEKVYLNSTPCAVPANILHSHIKYVFREAPNGLRPRTVSCAALASDKSTSQALSAKDSDP